MNNHSLHLQPGISAKSPFYLACLSLRLRTITKFTGGGNAAGELGQVRIVCVPQDRSPRTTTSFCGKTSHDAPPQRCVPDMVFPGCGSPSVSVAEDAPFLLRPSRPQGARPAENRRRPSAWKPGNAKSENGGAK